MSRAAGLLWVLLLGGSAAASSAHAQLAQASGTRAPAGQSQTPGAQTANEPAAPAPAGTEGTTISVDVLADGTNRSLTVTDFSATQGDLALTISSVRLMVPAGTTSALPLIASDDDEKQAASVADRLIAIYVDEYHLSPGANLDSAKAALAAFVRTSLGPRDLVVVVKPLASLTSIRLSSDRESAARAIEESAARQGDLTPRSSFEQQYFAADPVRIEAARSQIVLSSLSAVTTHLGRFANGRKTLVVLSDGLSSPPRSRVESVLPGEESITRSANQARVAVYLIRPEPPVRAGESRGSEPARRQGQEPPAGPVRGSRESGLRAGSRQAESRDSSARREPLAALAERTTGLVMDGASAANGLRQVLGDASRYYLLDIVAPQPPDDQYRSIAISSRQSGVRLRARDGYAVMRSRPVESDADTPARAMARIPRQTSRLIRVWFGQSASASGQTHVVFVWEPAPQMPGARIVTPGLSRVSLTVTASNGDTVFSGETIASGRALIAGSAAADRSQATFESAPGTLLAQIEILDAAGRVLDKDVRDVVVRAAAPGGFGTAAVYRARSAADLRALRDDVTAAPVASRQFSRAESLLIRTVTFGDAMTSTVSASLMSGLGSSLRALAVDSRAAAGQTTRQVEVPLAALASGQYSIEFKANSPAGTSVERVSFTVTP